MDFEWDAAKAGANQARHGISFEEAIAVFADPDLVVFDVSREPDGEPRSKAVGMIEGRLFVVVFTRRGDAFRIISARRTNTREDRIYGHHQGKA